LIPILDDAPFTVGGLSIPSELLIVVICVGMAFGVRLVKSMQAHQQRMTELLQPKMQQESQDVQALRHEVDLLKATVNQQTLLIDSLTTQHRQLAESLKPADGISQRLKAE
jgi:hypothetical protein